MLIAVWATCWRASLFLWEGLCVRMLRRTDVGVRTGDLLGLPVAVWACGGANRTLGRLVGAVVG
jgi:hypothetical protein